jgi:hypothetical protein
VTVGSSGGIVVETNVIGRVDVGSEVGVTGMEVT